MHRRPFLVCLAMCVGIPACGPTLDPNAAGAAQKPTGAPAPSGTAVKPPARANPAACRTQPLVNSRWLLRSIAGVAVQAGSRASIAFRDDGAEGHGGVNAFRLSYTMECPDLRDAGSLHVSGLSATEIGGSSPALDEERRLFEALAAATAFDYEGGRELRIATGKGELVFIDADAR